LGSIFASILSILNKGMGVDWKTFFVCGGLAASPLLFLRSKIPESPRWVNELGEEE